MNNYSRKTHKRSNRKLLILNLVLIVSLAIFVLLFIYYKGEKEYIKTETEIIQNNIELEDTQNEVVSEVEVDLENIANEQQGEVLEINNEELSYETIQEEVYSVSEQQEDENVEGPSYDFIVNKANATEEFINAIREQISIIPSYIIDSFIERKYTICITNQDLKEKLTLKEGELVREDATIYGLLDRTNQIMYLKYSDWTKDNYTVLHEFGHFADFFVYGHPSGTDEFYEIYCEEVQVVQSQSNTLIGNPYELYAEVFKFVFLEQNNNTKTYIYVKNSMQIE